MNSKHPITKFLGAWEDIYTDKMNTGEIDTTHLSEKTLHALSEDGGIEHAPPEAIEHLSLCPKCMDKWAGWREAISMADEDEPEADVIVSCGELKRRAAATDRPFEPTTAPSACGRFMLGLLPQVDDAKKGLVTLDVALKDGAPLENRYVMVRDRTGRVFLEGKIHHGRLARRCDNLADIDLSKWTVIEKAK